MSMEAQGRNFIVTNDEIALFGVHAQKSSNPKCMNVGQKTIDDHLVEVPLEDFAQHIECIIEDDRRKGLEGSIDYVGISNLCAAHLFCEGVLNTENFRSAEETDDCITLRNVPLAGQHRCIKIFDCETWNCDFIAATFGKEGQIL